ncbi:phage tail assembly protein [Labrenzia sp. R4_1]|uniref:phage tail assembly protein n=1 Tax=Labrenzia sp. R4_1 TaxID=2821106 RepID=UPI001ADB2387|nr:phage tail assembly protein [Labrenzia sp. R4_1]MBO9424700.1 phage tail assembly protein [Labrenzia sp. R4_1]
MAKPKSKDVKLEFPVEHDGREISVLTIRRMRAGDSLIAEGVESQAEAGFALLAELAGQPIEVIKALDLDDFAAASEAMASQMGKQSRALMKAMKQSDEAASPGGI